MNKALYTSIYIYRERNVIFAFNNVAGRRHHKPVVKIPFQLLFMECLLLPY